MWCLVVECGVAGGTDLEWSHFSRWWICGEGIVSSPEMEGRNVRGGEGEWLGEGVGSFSVSKS